MKAGQRTATSIFLSIALVLTQTFSLPMHAQGTIEETAAAPIKIAAASQTKAVLSPAAYEAATLLGILPQVERLIQIKQAGDGNPHNDEEMALKIDVFDKVLGCSLEIRMISGRIDRELAWSSNGQSMLQAKRQRNLNALFTANFMQGGILGVLSGPAFLHGKDALGTELLLLASSIGLLLSTASLAASRSGTKKIDGGTTILADVFHLSQPAQKHNYDTIVKYLNSVPPDANNNHTRINVLIDGWKKGRYLRSTKEKQLEKLAAIEGKTAKEKENIRLLDNRIRMLYDTQWTIEQLDIGLLDLLRITELN
ncbi:MAG: hypothetical protein K2W82_07805 [Candidatus Obscuribacterales bacterium]|nr:hypothetical protein [Candidatus Obscuribacterales bacterium]